MSIFNGIKLVKKSNTSARYFKRRTFFSPNSLPLEINVNIRNGRVYVEILEDSRSVMKVNYGLSDSRHSCYLLTEDAAEQFLDSYLSIA